MKKIMIVTSGSGSLINICLNFTFFKAQLSIIVCDRDCHSLTIGAKHGIDTELIKSSDKTEWSDKVLALALERKIDYIVSYSNLKIFDGDILDKYANRIFNSHYSLLPSFKGYLTEAEKKTSKFRANQVIERIMDFGSRITGNTIHVVTKKIDGGCPVIVSVLNIPYNEKVEATRHRIFVQECQTVLQMFDWFCKDRITVNMAGKVEIKDARFDKVGFSPNLESEEIINFKI